MEEQPRSVAVVKHTNASLAARLIVCGLPCALALATACAGRALPSGTIGVTETKAVRKDLPDASPPQDAGASSALPSDYRETFTKLNDARFVSRGHAPGRWDVDVYANDLATQALATRAKRVPQGAMIIEEHFERSGDAGARGPIFFMEKVQATVSATDASPTAGSDSEPADEFRYVIVGSQGQTVRDGRIASCAGCHDDSPMDGFFPLVP